MFGIIYIAITAAITAKWRTKSAGAALFALVGTVALWKLEVHNAGAYASALWALSGVYLLINSEYVAGTAYVMSGLVYIGYYVGLNHATFAVVPVVSDLLFAGGLLAGHWPGLSAWFKRGRGRYSGLDAVSAASKNCPGISLPDRG